MNTIASLVAGAMLAAATHGAFAAPRVVIINDVRLTTHQLAQLETRHCARIPSGRYWLDWQTGAWGFAGNPWPQGRLGDPCGNGGQRRHRSLSERGLLYTPGDLNFR